MRGDLANCDLGKSFSEIRCFFKGGSSWSDGTPITKADVLATYALFAETDLNKRLQSALSKTVIEDAGESVVFRTSSANVDLLDVFTVPIMNERAAKAVRDGSWRPESGPFSGPYVFERRETEEGSQSERVVFHLNPTFSGSPYVARYVLRFFSDRNALLAAKDTLNAVYPNRSVGATSSPRFAPLTLSLPEFVGLFANASEVPLEVRSLALSIIGNAELATVKAAGRPVLNPFFTEETLVPVSETKNPEEIMSKIGFFKKAALEERAKKPVSAPTKANRYFESPTDAPTYVGGDSDDLLISGSVPENVTEVYVNDYRLQGFVAKSGKFYYRAKASFGTLKEGKNEYVLSFVENGVKTKKESLVVEYVKDSETREKRKSELRAAAEAAARPVVSTGASRYADLVPNGYYDES